VTLHTQGSERERDLPRDIYFSDNYFSMPQLCTFAHQIDFIHSMRPKSAIEIGLGNGFVSTYLRRAGLRITTADINPALEPDICAPLAEVHQHIKQPADLVICCEVLEHMPLEELDANLDHLRGLGERLFLTLPNSYRVWGLSGLAFLPKIGGGLFDLNVNIPWKRPIAGGPHFWEVGYRPSCSRKAIVKRLRQRYRTVRSGRFALNPYHIWFICE
jgi:hypothetical protein